MKCKVCKCELVVDSDICPSCGAINFDKNKTEVKTIVKDNNQVDEIKKDDSLRCKRCGKEIESDWNSCAYCGFVVNDKKKDIFIIEFLVGLTLSLFGIFVIDSFIAISFGFIISMMSLVEGMIKCRNNTLFKVLLGLYVLAIMIGSVVWGIRTINSCINDCRDFGRLG